jgi:hypothetical protein
MSLNLTPYGYSQRERCERELQSVKAEKGDTVAFDWTFQVIKNYNLPGAKALFTANKGSTREIFALAIVQSTALKEVSHLLTQIVKKRKTMNPSVIYTDTCPDGIDFYKKIFGPTVCMRLGLFHMMQRITSTLDKKCELYPKAIAKLKEAFYTYNEDDEAALLASLKDGTLSATGEGMTDSQIAEIRLSKQWKQRYDTYLRKNILSPPLIQNRLSGWMLDWLDQKDACQNELFGYKTTQAINEQLTKTFWVSDPQDITMYKPIPAARNAKHKLPKWHSNRPESALEKFHEALATYANGGTGRELADVLTLSGTSDHNIRCRWKEHQNARRLDGELQDEFVHFEEEPPFWDHSLLGVINQLAQAQGYPRVFNFCVEIESDNGEKFLSQYFFTQKQRNQENGQEKNTGMCLCISCIDNLPGNATRTTAIAQEPMKNPQFSTPTMVQQQQDHHNDKRQKNSQNVVTTRPMQISPMTSYLPLSTFHVPPVGCYVPPPPPCFCHPPWWCFRFADYAKKKMAGVFVRGTPPHDVNCPKRQRGVGTPW